MFLFTFYSNIRSGILCDLPEPYLVWFHRKGFPPGKISFRSPQYSYCVFWVY
ncbi:putative quorum-sensing-regulated virulence factor [Chloroflexota bacterium]